MSYSEIIPGLEVDIRPETLLKVGTLKGARESSIKVTGALSSVSVGNGTWLRSAKLLIESPNSSIHLAEDVFFTGAIFLKGAGPNHVTIGRGSTFGQVNIICSEGSAVYIGDDCMFSWGIEIRTTDSHGIYDLDSGDRINPASDIRVGSHVWVAAKAALLKGSIIPSGCVVGMNSVTTKDFHEQNSILAGNPAKTIRSNIKWERPLLG